MFIFVKYQPFITSKIIKTMQKNIMDFEHPTFLEKIRKVGEMLSLSCVVAIDIPLIVRTSCQDVRSWHRDRC